MQLDYVDLIIEKAKLTRPYSVMKGYNGDKKQNKSGVEQRDAYAKSIMYRTRRAMAAIK